MFLMVPEIKPNLFSLMAGLTVEARQKFGERRRALKAREGVEERLVETEKGKWKLEYWQGQKKIDELAIV